MTKVPCLTWVQLLCSQVHQLFAQKRTREKTSPDIVLLNIDLPHDILVEIFSRLPAECVLLCGHTSKSLRPSLTTPSFVDMHLTRATPVIAFQYIDAYDFNDIRNFNIHFTDDEYHPNKIVTKHNRLTGNLEGFTSFIDTCRPVLYASYNGFMLIKNEHLGSSALYIWNPITQENMILLTPSFLYCCRGFFFHPMSREHRALFMYNNGQCFSFLLYGVGAKILERKIDSFSHPPSPHGQPTILNGSLHWMVDDLDYKSVFGDFPHCLNSIVVFNMESERFCTMPHPGHQYHSCNKHSKMQLMEMKGFLCYCDFSSGKDIVVWILEDYGKWFWTKKHVVVLATMRQTCIVRCGCRSRLNSEPAVEAICIYGKELLVTLYWFDIFLYNLEFGTFRRVGKRCANSRYAITVVPHTNSLISLRTCQQLSFP